MVDNEVNGNSGLSQECISAAAPHWVSVKQTPPPLPPNLLGKIPGVKTAIGLASKFDDIDDKWKVPLHSFSLQGGSTVAAGGLALLDTGRTHSSGPKKRVEAFYRALVGSCKPVTYGGKQRCGSNNPVLPQPPTMNFGDAAGTVAVEIMEIGNLVLATSRVSGFTHVGSIELQSG